MQKNVLGPDKTNTFPGSLHFEAIFHSTAEFVSLLCEAMTSNSSAEAGSEDINLPPSDQLYIVAEPLAPSGQLVIQI